MAEVEISIPSRLVPQELETAVTRAEISFGPIDDALRGGTLNVDLRAVSWVDIGAAAQLVLQVDGWGNELKTVVVRFPSAFRLPADKNDEERLWRTEVMRFIRYIRLAEAFHEIAKRRTCSVSVLLDDIPLPLSQPLPRTGSNQGFPDTYLKVVPLKWVPLGDTEDRRAIAQHLTAALRSSGDGVDGPDAMALSNVVLNELIENVVEHSKSGDAALVCGFAHSKNNQLGLKEYLPEEAPYIDATRAAGLPLLEIFVGDSGHGIIRTLEGPYRKGPGLIPGNLTKNGIPLPKNVVRWAFDRWSTEKPQEVAKRGVRGLYRIDRLVARYFGQVSVRTERLLYVREHIVRDELVERTTSAPKALPHFRGTCLRVRMTGFTVPGISELMASYTWNRVPKKKHSDLIPQSLPEYLFVGKLCDTGFPAEIEDRIFSKISSTSSRPESLFICFTETTEDIRAVEPALRFLASHANPVPIYALNIPIGSDELSSAVDSVNDETTQTEAGKDGAASLAERLDIVCAVNHAGIVHWVGVPQHLVRFLQQVTTNGRTPIPEEILGEIFKLELRLKPFFTIERQLEGWGHTTLRCTVDLSPFRDFVHRTLIDSLSEKVERTYALRSGPYLTPNLNFVQDWFRVDALVRGLEERIFQVVVFELSRALYGSFQPVNRSSESALKTALLFTEESSSSLISSALAARFDFRPFEGFGKQTSSGMLPSSVKTTTPVVIYADIVSTGESLRRAAQTVLRLGFKVAAVVALLDTRRTSSGHLEAFGHSIPLVTLLHYPNEVRNPRKFSVIAPNLVEVECRNATPADLLSDVSQSGLRDEITAQSIEFKHRIRQNGRHLTLTLNPHRLLRSDALSMALANAIRNFFPINPADGSVTAPIVVLVPSDHGDERWQAGINELFNNALKGHHLFLRFVLRTTIGGKVSFQRPNMDATFVRKAAGVLIFDWGMISGRSVDEITDCALQFGACRVLVLVANSQLAISELEFRQRVIKLKVARFVRMADDLFGDSVRAEEIVEYKFVALNTLPLGFYSGEADCPVCTQARELLAIPCGDRFIAGYRQSALDALLEPGERSVNASPDGKNTLGIAVSALRAKLIASESETRARYRVQNELEKLAREVRECKQVTDDCIAIITLLYVEGIWIYRPPLRFRSCRDPVALICRAVIDWGTADDKAMAIAVLRKVSKRRFLAQAPAIFENLDGNENAQGALLLGIHTYLASRYHESITMLAPAQKALEEIANVVIARNSDKNPRFLQAFRSVKYLSFQAAFLGSRAESRTIDRARALKLLRDTLSEPNYYAHGAENDGAELLLQTQFLDAMRQLIRNAASDGEHPWKQAPLLMTLLTNRIETWQQVRKFLVTKILPLAAKSREELESQEFLTAVGDDSVAQWFLNMVESHTNGLAPDLAPDIALVQLYEFMTHGLRDSSSQALLRTMDDYVLEMSRLYTMIFRPKRIPRESANRPGSSASYLKEFLDQLGVDLLAALDGARSEVESMDRYLDLQFVNASEVQERIEVSCTRNLLRRTFVELFRNVLHHGARNERGCASAEVHIRSDKNNVEVTVRNRYGHRSDIADPLRHGLALLRRELAKFGATLDDVPGGSDFAIHVVLRRWR